MLTPKNDAISKWLEEDKHSAMGGAKLEFMRSPSKPHNMSYIPEDLAGKELSSENSPYQIEK